MWHHADIKVLPDKVHRHACLSPDKLALTEGRLRLTFGEIDTASNRIAHAVARERGASGSVVGFVGKNSASFFEILFGVGKAGCTLLPLNWRLAALEIAPIVDDALPALIFVDKEFVPLLEAVLKTAAHQCKLVVFDPTAADSGLAAWCGDAPAQQIDFADALPISPTGKILKRALRDAFWQGQWRTVG